MAKGSDNPFPSVLLVESASPANPAAGHQRLFVATVDGLVKLRDSGGVERPFGEMSDTAPLALGTAAAGAAVKVSRDDHVHPTEASDVVPLALGVAASGVGTGLAREDHVHPAVVPANVQTASYTLVAGDVGRAVEMDVATANGVTVPAGVHPAGAVVEVCQAGAGQTTVVAGAGVTIQTPQTLVLSGQWSSVSLRHRGSDVWVLAGDVEASA